MSDHFQKLLSKKMSFLDLIDQTSATLTRLKQQNDSLQNNSELELDAQIIKIISQQKDQMKLSIAQAKENLIELEKIAKGLEQRKQVKKMRQVFIKEVERNKQIIRGLIQKSFGSFADQEDDGDDIDERQLNNAFPEQSQKLSQSDLENHRPQQVQVMDAKQMKQKYQKADFDNQLSRERQEDLNKLEKDALNLNSIMGQLAMNVDEQDGQLDIIQEHFIKTKQNIEGANKELLITDKMSRDGKKKYLILALLVLIMTSALVSSLFYFDYIEI